MKPNTLIFMYHYAYLFSLAAISAIALFAFKSTGADANPSEITFTLPLILMTIGIFALTIAKKFIFPDLDRPEMGDYKKTLSEYNGALKNAVSIFIPCTELPYILGFVLYVAHKNITEYAYFVGASFVLYLYGAWNLNQLKGAIQKLSANHML